MRTNRVYDSMNDQYMANDETKGRSNRVHLRVDHRKLPFGLMGAIDREADRKFDGGYKLRKNGKSNVCEKCYMTKSTNGTCNCAE